MSNSTLAVAATRSIRIHMLACVAMTILLAGGVGGWAATTHIAGAVMAGGNLVVDSNVKKVQHLTGGVVKDLYVRDDDEVKAGDVLIHLDETQAKAALEIVSKSLAELYARQARLVAERDGLSKLDFRDLRATDLPKHEIDRMMQGEQRLFEIRTQAAVGKKSQLRERTGQLKEEIQGLTGQVTAKGQEFKLISDELVGVRELWKKNLIQVSRVTSLERDSARIDGERNALISQIAQAKGKITETELQILQVEQDMRGDVGKELRELQGKVAELRERKVAAEDTVAKIDIKAPQTGRVHQLAVHTVGGVVSPGEAIMLIVPDVDPLTVEARITPQDRDQVHMGQTAVLRFSAFNQRTTPELKGEVKLVSPDITQDQKTGQSFYTIRIAVLPEELARLGGLKLVPGMPVESFIQTGDRSVISYLTKPLMDQVTRTFQEK